MLHPNIYQELTTTVRDPAAGNWIANCKQHNRYKIYVSAKTISDGIPLFVN